MVVVMSQSVHSLQPFKQYSAGYCQMWIIAIRLALFFLSFLSILLGGADFKFCILENIFQKQAIFIVL